MTETLGSAAGQPGGLRERKKVRTRAAIRAIFGVILAVTMPWEDWSSKHINADLFARMDAGLAHPENGLRR